ncbi:hypothetical protein M422DRAFT_35741 [Sphaerobolus stellatus SS14]|uniref:Uncharacterized protein n=1 Tax=Sphaerobolus stellatus (strain SS14) TaxID=990650 RepID=A0A0C9V5B4_SPHS4|nr:hypothetical protein M422DRAFT_35741 [Sphaerobolus stellatus SS14]
MLRRYTPYLIAATAGVISGVWIFDPIFREQALQRQQQAAKSNDPSTQQTETKQRGDK